MTSSDTVGMCEVRHVVVRYRAMFDRAARIVPSRAHPAQMMPAMLTLIVALLVVVAVPSTVSAHTGFESSLPAEGDTVGEPVELVTVVFTGEATPVGDGFAALTPAGDLQEPASVQTLDDKLFTIRFDPSLAGGDVGLRWNVQAADAHPIEGAFAFTVTAPAPPQT